MRFHIGFSKFIKPQDLLKFLAFLFLGALAFFGIDKYVLAATLPGSSANEVVIYDSNMNQKYFATSNIPTISSSTTTYSAFGRSTLSGVSSINAYDCYGSPIRGNTKGTIDNTDYLSHLILQWKYNNITATNNSGNVKITTRFMLQQNNSNMFSNPWDVLSTFCANNLESVTGSMGTCQPYMIVDGVSYTMTNISTNGNFADYEVTVPSINNKNVYVRLPNTFPSTTKTIACNSSDVIANWNVGLYIVSANTTNDDVSDNTTDQAIVDAINGQTSDIVDEIQNQTDSINSTINDSTDAIIGSIEDSNQHLIDSNTTCKSRILYYSDTVVSGGLSNNGDIIDSSVFGVTDFLHVSNITYNSWYNVNYNLCFYTSDRVLISCINYLTISSGSSGNIIIPENAYYVRFSIRNNNVPVFTIFECKNINQAIYDSINDDSQANYDLIGLDDFDFTYFDSISDLFLFPINTLQRILDIVTQDLDLYYQPSRNTKSEPTYTCTPITIDFSSIVQAWGDDTDSYVLTLPCMRSILSDYLTFSGFSLYDLIDLLLAASCFWHLLKYVVSKILDFSSGTSSLPTYFAEPTVWVNNNTGEVNRF